MKIVTWNINGYRSAEKEHHLEEMINKNKPNIICLQEIKINEEFEKEYGYDCYYHFAHKKGYSGTCILTKEKPLHVIYDTGYNQLDEEGRFLLLEYPNFYLIDIYIPHGGRKKENHPFKFKVIEKLFTMIKKLEKPVIICTDFNIAHTELDVKNYKTNYKNNLFSEEERAKIDELLHLGFVDSFRLFPQEKDIYSMWPNGFHARERNMGWRIDYIFVSRSLESKIKSVCYLKEQMGSDHCPCIMEINI